MKYEHVVFLMRLKNSTQKICSQVLIWKMLLKYSYF